MSTMKWNRGGRILRRNRVANGLLAGLGGCVLFSMAASAFAADALIRFSTAAPPSDFLAKSVDLFKSEVERANVGLKVESHPASSLFKQGTEVPAMQRGTLEMSSMTTFEVAQQIPAFGFVNRAFAFRDYAHLQAVFNGPIGEEYRRAVDEKMGIHILATAYLGTRQVALRQKRKVATPADLAGIKLRMPAGPEWLLLGQTLGVSPIPMGMPEVYLALKTGTIDGQENPLSIFSAAKLYEVSEQVVLTSHMVQPVFFNIASKFYDHLNDAQKKTLQAAAEVAVKVNDSGRPADEKSITEALRGRGLEVTAIDLAPFHALADKVYAQADATAAWDKALAQRVKDTR